ncbi:MAG: FtsX-like permease family protein [Candidatus Nealsonbacteria bacterium]|nr:FtsX-like permease family protein [Candidatus Nealsonbacteria bacterium]
MLTTIKRVLKLGWQAFYRDGEIALATIFVLFLSITLVSSLFLFKDVSQFLIAKLEEKVDVSVYFKEGATEEDVLGLKEELSDFPEIKEVEYVSPEEAQQEFVQRHQDEPLLLESMEELGRNPFLASLNIKAWQPSQYEKVSQFLENPEFTNLIEKVDYYQRKLMISRLSSFNSMITRAGVSVALLLIIVATAVTFNTIRLSIYNLRKEIKVQRLVGASNWFIRGPFLVQGAICGLLATTISLLTLAGASWFLTSRVGDFFAGLDIFTMFLNNFQIILAIQLLTGIGLGVTGSTIAIRKYLNE